MNKIGKRGLQLERKAYPQFASRPAEHGLVTILLPETTFVDGCPIHHTLRITCPEVYVEALARDKDVVFCWCDKGRFPVRIGGLFFEARDFRLISFWRRVWIRWRLWWMK